MKISNQKVLYIMTDNASIDDIMWGLLELGIDAEYSRHRPKLFPYEEESMQALRQELTGYDLAITHNFSVNVAEACHLLSIPYIAWLFDSPQVATYTKYALYPECHIFSFDKAQERRLKAINLPNVYYQPLAANIMHSAKINITDADIAKYSCDLSFIGQLYRNTTFEKFYEVISEAERKVVDDAIMNNVSNWSRGSNIYNSFSDEYVEQIEHFIPTENFETYNVNHKHIFETLILPPAIAQIERKKLMILASEICNARLYTVDRDVENATALLGSDKVFPAIHDDDLYKAYYASKINLNVTLRSIETGAPQRIFDIMSVGGTVLSNYQEELEELFVPDKEIMLFESEEEYIDKITYLLTHEQGRITIGINGYKRVVAEYNFKDSLSKMIEKI